MTHRFFAGFYQKRRELKRISPYSLHYLAILFCLKFSKHIAQINPISHKMSKLQFEIDEDCLYSPLSPDVVNIFSGSEDVFTVEPGNVVQLQEKFRINSVDSNLMTAFVGSSIATLYTEDCKNEASDNIIDTSGTMMERELMNLVGQAQEEQSIGFTERICGQ